MLKCKKLIAAALAVAMLMSVGTSVFAEDAEGDALLFQRAGMSTVNTYEDETGVMPLAAEAGYISTLSMSADSNHYGAYRDFLNSTYECTIENAYGMVFDPDLLMEWDLSVRVLEKSLFSETVLSSDFMHFSQNGQTKVAYFGDCGSGKRAFSFHTPYSSGIKSNSVLMTSD